MAASEEPDSKATYHYFILIVTMFIPTPEVTAEATTFLPLIWQKSEIVYSKKMAAFVRDPQPTYNMQEMHSPSILLSKWILPALGKHR